MGGKRTDASPNRSQEPRARLDDEPPPPHQRPRGRRQRPSVRHHRLILRAQSTQAKKGDFAEYLCARPEVLLPRVLPVLLPGSARIAPRKATVKAVCRQIARMGATGLDPRPSA